MEASRSVGHITSLRGAPGYVRLTTTGRDASPVKRCACREWADEPLVVGSLCCLACRGRWWRRGIVLAWSRRSRQRLTRTLAACDFAALSDRWVLVTLTYERSFRRDPRRWKSDLSAFRLRWVRKFGSVPRGFVVLEWQRPRQVGENAGEAAPHWHGVFVAPAGVEIAEVETWAKGAWHAVVAGSGHGAPCTTRYRAAENKPERAALCAHAEFGADVEPAHAGSASMYLTRELGKARQKVLPPEWLSRGVGRWWMRWGDVPLVEHIVPVSDAEFVVLHQWLRRIAHRRGYHFESRYEWQGLLLFDRASTSPGRRRRKRDLRAAGHGPPRLDSANFAGEGGVFFDAVIEFLSRWRAAPNWARNVDRVLRLSYCCCAIKDVRENCAASL